MFMHNPYSWQNIVSEFEDVMSRDGALGHDCETDRLGTSNFKKRGQFSTFVGRNRCQLSLCCLAILLPFSAFQRVLAAAFKVNYFPFNNRAVLLLALFFRYLSTSLYS